MTPQRLVVGCLLWVAFASVLTGCVTGDARDTEPKDLPIAQQWNGRSACVVVDAPNRGAVVSSPLRVRGRARGNWFFEGDFPIVLKDANGKVIARGFATAKDEWMTEKFVPFEGTLEFKKPSAGDRGTLILKKDNPTGLPEHDDALKIPVSFK